MYRGISNLEIEKTLKTSKNDNINKKPIGIFPSGKINELVHFHKIIKARGAKYPFLISNMDRSDKEGTHWWSILDIHPKTEIFFFDSFGIKEFYHSRR